MPALPCCLRLRSILFCPFFYACLLFIILFPLNSMGAEPPKEILSAKIDLKVKWDKRDDAGNRCHGQMQIKIQGILKLNQQFSSLQQGLPAVMVPYKATAMSGHYTYKETKEIADRNHCSNPESRFEDAGTFIIEPYPGPGNLMLHYMGNMSKQLAPVKNIAPAGAFDSLIDRYLFAVTIPKKEVKGILRPDAKPCITRNTTRMILGDKIQIHFKFNEDGTMSGQRTWSSDNSPSADVGVSNLPAVFNAKPYSPQKVSSGDVNYNLRWEIKEPCLARISLEVELPSGKKTWKDITDSEAEITVGKKLRFKGIVLPEGKEKKPIGDWILQGDGGGKHKPYFKQFDANTRYGRRVEVNPDEDLKQKHIITLYWSGGKQGSVRFRTESCNESLTAEAKLKVIKPNYKVDVIAQQGSTIGPAFTGGALNKDCMGSGAHGAVKEYKWWLQYDGIQFNAENQDKGKTDGKEQWVQILRKHDLWVKFDDAYKSHQYVTQALDACYPYERGPKAMDRPGVPLGENENDSMTEEHRWVDDQDNIIKTTHGTLMYTKAIQDCRMVLMFRPRGKKKETQWVPIKEILWTWTSSAGYSRSSNWQLYESSVSPQTPKAEDTDRFPEWEKNSADIKAYVID